MSIIRIAFIITSVINTISSELTYGPRSYYTMEERFQQTLQTVHSIRSKVPHADIYLIEGSQIPYEMEFILESLVNYYINVNNDNRIRRGIESKLKGYGETLQIKHIFDTFSMIQYDNIFKISGRYYLNANFSLDRITKYSTVVFCKGKRTNIVSTVLFMIPREQIQIIRSIYYSVSRLYEAIDKRVLRGSRESLHYEYIIPGILYNYTVISPIGVEGLVSSYKTFYSC